VIFPLSPCDVHYSKVDSHAWYGLCETHCTVAYTTTRGAARTLLEQRCAEVRNASNART
jgi:hypothetical protein